MKNKIILSAALVAVFALSNCTSKTVVVEVTPAPVVKKSPPKPKPAPTPAQFKVVNQYDSDAR